jgi:hypothetical protein
MIQVPDNPPTGLEYAVWRKRAEDARDKAIDHWAKTKEVKLSELWGELKDIFLHEVFHEKCAYCEAKHADGFPCDVEHYRPKKEVTENRTAINHPGYFWLAYEWWNLLLSCRHCNSKHSERRQGKKHSHPGKLNEFRVLGTRVFYSPGTVPGQWRTDLEQEHPLLLNPYFDKPAEHIAFDDLGVPYARNNSERGRETIQVCDLDRLKLVEARRNKARDAGYAALNRQMLEAEQGKTRTTPYFGPEHEFSAWLNHYVGVLLRRMLPPSP